MRIKTHHQHLMEEKAQAAAILRSLKKSDTGKAIVYLADHAHTVLLVKKSRLEEKVKQLQRQGKAIRRIL